MGKSFNLMKNIAVIPARMGSQRLKKKNLRLFNGKTLIEHCINRCIYANCFDEIWVNSEDIEFKKYADKNDIFFYKRSKILGNSESTSEDYIFDFLKNVKCDNLFQVHTIAPLLTPNDINDFTKYFLKKNLDTLLAYIEDKIEVVFEEKPINFSFDKKTNSQNLTPTKRITWAITGWKSSCFLNAKKSNKIGTYSGRIGYFKLNQNTGYVIKTLNDLKTLEILSHIKF